MVSLSTSPIVVSNQQMLSLFLHQKYYFHVKMLAICTPMNQIARKVFLLKISQTRQNETTTSKIFLNQHIPLVCQKQK